MTKNSNPPKGGKQARSDREYSEELKKYKAAVKEDARLKRLEQKQAQKETKEIIKAARKVGLYNPKSLELTPYRVKRAREIKRNFGEYINPEKHFFLPANKQARKRILERATQLQMQASRTGIFFPKDNYKTAQLKEDRKRGEFGILRKGKVKKGPNAGKIYTDYTPLPSIDELGLERNRLRKMAENLGPLKPGEAFAFEVIENGHEGYSVRTFNGGDTEKAIEALLKELESYDKMTAAKVNFFRHVRIVKTVPKTWRELHPPKPPKPRGRIRKSRGFDTRGSKG